MFILCFYSYGSIVLNIQNAWSQKIVAAIKSSLDNKWCFIVQRLFASINKWEHTLHWEKYQSVYDHLAGLGFLLNCACLLAKLPLYFNWHFHETSTELEIYIPSILHCQAFVVNMQHKYLQCTYYFIITTVLLTYTCINIHKMLNMHHVYWYKHTQHHKHL